jgi:transposase
VYRTDWLEEATAALDAFYEAIAEVDIPEVRRLGRTIRRWHDEVLAYWRCDGLSNGVNEAINMLIKRIGHGFRNLAVSRHGFPWLIGVSVMDFPDRPSRISLSRRHRYP